MNFVNSTDVTYYLKVFVLHGPRPYYEWGLGTPYRITTKKRRRDIIPSLLPPRFLPRVPSKL